MAAQHSQSLEALLTGIPGLIIMAPSCPLDAKGLLKTAIRSSNPVLFFENKLLYGPGKAANAGGVAVSGLEMAQNSMRLSWPREEVDNRLKQIMKSIHHTCTHAAEDYGEKGNYVAGANIAGFVKVVNAMLDQGLV